MLKSADIFAAGFGHSSDIQPELVVWRLRLRA
jgi:hypothetical protein